MRMTTRKYRYATVFSALKDEILAGNYENDALLPSEREISLRFSVERTTVRKALELLVEEGLVQKHAGVGTKVTYKKNQSANDQGLHRVVGFFITDDEVQSRKITQPYYADLFYNLEVECKTQNCQLIYSTIHPDTDITEILQTYNFIAAVFVTRMDYKYIEQTQKMKIPIILVNECYDGLTTISCDQSAGAYAVVNYLAEMGHTNIGIVTGLTGYVSSEEKMMGCYKAINERHLQLLPQNFVAGNWEYQSGYDAAMRIFSNQPESAPTAVFAFNDMMAIGVMRALRDLSIAVPEDVSVVGFDNMDQLKFTEPNLTTVDGNIKYLSKMIVESAVNNTFGSYEQGAKLLVPVRLIKRGTVKNVL